MSRFCNKVTILGGAKGQSGGGGKHPDEGGVFGEPKIGKDRQGIAVSIVPPGFKGPDRTIQANEPVVDYR